MTAGRTNHTLFAAPPRDMHTPPPAPRDLTRCKSDQDGHCVHALCPQLRDGEPKASGRSCPLYDWTDPYE